ncbi:MAG: NAD(P)/FAD-dependent oxidoreductase, partial [Candidatus Promineifilaceae bacterium]
MSSAEVVICGAGLAGISAAYFLTVKQGITDVVLVDERPPLTLTSDKSTECYRNWWPGPGDTMVRFMNHSIDLLEELADRSNNYFGLNRRGYVFLTADPDRVESFRSTAETISALGAGPLRIHEPGHSTYRP